MMSWQTVNWEPTGKLNLPNSAEQWTLMIADDLLEARCYFDKNIGAYYWQTVVGEVPAGSGECVTLEDAQQAAQDCLWKFFEMQRDFWVALTLPSPKLGEGERQGAND
jgi:hypothetical protein